MESGMMDSYYKRKQGLETVEYDHPVLEEVLKPTYGVPVYQEQVMRMARVVAGYTPAGADKLRKIMGKKLPEEMKKERVGFVKGSIAGRVEITTDDGTTRIIHRSETFKVKEGPGEYTIEDIFSRSLSPLF
jgi:DNA polymerase III alpha subunit